MDEREARAEVRRRTWEGSLSRTGEHPPMGRMHPETALAAMWETAVDCWLMSGREIPRYGRHEMPGRIYRPGDDLPEPD